MFKFSLDVTLMKKCEKLLRRSNRTPTKFSVLCSCHFKIGQKENLPTIFEHNKLKLFQFSSPEKQKRKKICSYGNPGPSSNIDTNEVLTVESQVENSSNILEV
ncbi:hypothetical protein FQA39_LY11815 [Lamprigera yunnana]|nr:hypothetical protein FQA39_LY11815 [Lamprigera yunnana]